MSDIVYADVDTLIVRDCKPVFGTSGQFLDCDDMDFEQKGSQLTISKRTKPRKGGNINIFSNNYMSNSNIVVGNMTIDSSPVRRNNSRIYLNGENSIKNFFLFGSAIVECPTTLMDFGKINVCLKNSSEFKFYDFNYLGLNVKTFDDSKFSIKGSMINHLELNTFDRSQALFEKTNVSRAVVDTNNDSIVQLLYIENEAKIDMNDNSSLKLKQTVGSNIELKNNGKPENFELVK